MTRAVVVYNRLAGAGRGEDVAERAERALRDAGFEVERIPTRDRRGAAPVAREVAGRVDLLVVVGGDGSLREAVEGLGAERSRVTLGLLPLGNANVVAHELGIPLDPRAAVSVLLDGAPVEMDAAKVRAEAFETWFLAVVGLGWDAITVGIIDRIRRSRLGRIWYRLWADSVYAAAGLLAALRPGLRRIRLHVDGVAQETAYCAAYFCNLRTYGKGMAMAPDAHATSGLIHYQARKRWSLPFLAWHLWAALRGRRSPRFLSDYGCATRIEVRADVPVPVEIDGDYCGSMRSLELRVEPRAVRILAPRPILTKAATPMEHDSMSDEGDRLGQLEVHVSRLRRALRAQTALIVALLAAFTLAASSDPKELTLGKRVVVDAAGTRRIEAGVTKEGAAVMQILDQKGKVRFEAATGPDSLPRLLLADPDGKARVTATSRPGGTAAILLQGGGRGGSVMAEASPTGLAAFSVLDADRKVRVRMLTHSDGRAELLLNDRDAKTRVGATTKADGRAGLELYDRDARRRLTLSTSPEGTADIVLTGPDGQPQWRELSR